MHEDVDLNDLLPNEAGSEIFQPTEPKEATRERNEERNRVTAAGPLIDTLLSWFDTEITLASSIATLDTESRVSLEGQVLAQQQLRQSLLAARGRLQALRDEYIK